MAWSHNKLEFLLHDHGVWANLVKQRGLLDVANERLAAKSVEAEDLCLRCTDLTVEATSAWERMAPLD